MRLDDTVLQQFQLNEPRLDTMRTENDERHLKLLQSDEPPRDELTTAARDLQKAYDELEKQQILAKKELRRWQIRLEAERRRGFSGPDSTLDKAYYERRADLARKIEAGLAEWEQSVKDNRAKLTTFLLQVGQMPRDEAARTIRDLINKQYRSRLSEVFAAQTRIRVFLIELKPVQLTVDQAIQIALDNRLDLKNQLAAVTDAWRNVEVDANAAPGLSRISSTMQTFHRAPNHASLFQFDAGNSIQTVRLPVPGADQPPGRAEPVSGRPDRVPAGTSCLHAHRDQIVQQIRLDMRELVAQWQRSSRSTASRFSQLRSRLEQAEEGCCCPAEARHAGDLNLLTALERVLFCPERADPDLGHLRDQPIEPLS